MNLRGFTFGKRTVGANRQRFDARGEVSPPRQIARTGAATWAARRHAVR